MPEPGKNAPGLRGFPTPNEVPGNEGYLVFRFNGENDWAGLLLGAAQALTYEWNFYQWGALTPAEAAEAWRVIVQEAPYNLLTSSKIPTPFWDDDADVDDEAEPDEQTWYGTVSDPEAPPDELDFVENALVWIFTGFIAAATLEVGAAPAILFRTIAPKFLIASKRGDLGEIIRIIVDGEEAARVDTSPYAPGEVIRTPIVADPDLAEHNVVIVQVS